MKVNTTHLKMKSSNIFNINVPETRSEKQKKTTRIANKTHSRVLANRKPSPVTIITY